jgi:hypothetical protein
MKRRPRLLEHDEVIKLLRSEVAKSGSQRKWAKENDVTRVVVCRVLGGHARVQPKIIEALGLEEIRVYRNRKSDRRK